MSDATPKTKPKLLVILGAGSSLDLGMPSVESLAKPMKAWAADWAEGNRQPDYYKLVWDNREQAVKQKKRSTWAEPIKPNYERCLGDLHALMNGTLPNLGSFSHSEDLLTAVGLCARENQSPKKVSESIQALLKDLLRLLVSQFRDRCADFAKEIGAGRKDEFGRYCTLFSTLRERFDLGVYNLNHDTVALTALGDLETGFGRPNGWFEAAEVQGRREWNFLYHLHGSVHQSLGNPDGSEVPGLGPLPICWAEERLISGTYHDAWTPQETTDSRWVTQSTLVAGGWKLDQIQAEPYQTFYSVLPRHVHEADAILIAGYGFGDAHVNSVLRNVLSSRAASRPKVLVIGFAEPKDRPMVDQRLIYGQELFADDRWNYELRSALGLAPTDDFYRVKTLSAPCPDWEISEDPIERNEYALCRERSVAFWFGGMLASGMREVEHENWVSSIVDWLFQHPPAR